MPKKMLPETSPLNYETAALELDTLLQQMESAQMPLDQLLSGYQRGAFLLKFCRDQLQILEEQVSVLDGSMLKIRVDGA